MDRDVHPTFYDGYESGHKVYYSLRSIEEIEQDEALNDARDETMLSIDSHFQNLSDEALAVLEAIFVSDVPIGEFISFHRPQVAKLTQHSDPAINLIASNLTKEAVSGIKTYRRKCIDPSSVQIPRSRTITRILSQGQNGCQTVERSSPIDKEDRSLSYSNFVNAMKISMNLSPHVSTEIFNLLCKGTPNKTHYLYDDLISSFSDIRSPLRKEFPLDAACAIYAQCNIHWLDLLNYLNARAGSVSEQQLGIRLEPVPIPGSFCHRLTIDTCLYVEGLDIYMTCSRDNLAQFWLPPHLNLSLGQMKHLEYILKLDEITTHRFGLNREFFEKLLYDLTELSDPTGKTTAEGQDAKDDQHKGHILTKKHREDFCTDGRTKRAIDTILNLTKFLDRMSLYDLHTEDISWLIKLSNTDNSIGSYLNTSNVELHSAEGIAAQEAAHNKTHNKVDFSLIRSLTNPDTDKTILPLKDNTNLPRLIVEDMESRPEAYKDTFTYSLVTAIRETDNALISLRPRGNKIKRTLKPEVLAHYGPKFVQDLIEEEERDRQKEIDLQKHIEQARAKYSNNTLLLGHSRIIKQIKQEFGLDNASSSGNAVIEEATSVAGANQGTSNLTPIRTRQRSHKDWADSVIANEGLYETADTAIPDYRDGFCGSKYVGRTVSGTARAISGAGSSQQGRALSALQRPSSNRALHSSMYVAQHLSNSAVLGASSGAQRRDSSARPSQKWARLDDIDENPHSPATTSSKEGVFAMRMKMLSRPASLSAQLPAPPPPSKQSTASYQRTRFNKYEFDNEAHAVEHPLSKLKAQYLQASQGDTKAEQNLERTRQIVKLSDAAILRQARASANIAVKEYVNPLYERLERHKVMAEMEKSAKFNIVKDAQNTTPTYVASWASAAVYDRDNDCLVISCEVGCVRLYRISKDFDLIKKVQVADTSLNTLCSVTRTVSMLSINEYADTLKMLFVQLPTSTANDLLDKFNLQPIKARLWSAITNDHYIYTSEGFGIYDDYLFNNTFTTDLGQKSLDLSTLNASPTLSIFQSTDERDIKQHYISGLDFTISLTIPGYLSPAIAPRNGERPCKSKLFVSTTSSAIYFQLGKDDILKPAAVVTNYLGDPFLTGAVSKADAILLGGEGNKFEALLPDGPPVINYKTLNEYNNFGPNTRRVFHSISVYNFYVLYNLELLFNYIHAKLGEIAKVCHTNNKDLIKAFFKRDLNIKIRGDEGYVDFTSTKKQLSKRPAAINFSENIKSAEGTTIDDIVQGIVEQIIASIEPIDSESALSPVWKGAIKGIASFMNSKKSLWITCNQRWHSTHDNADVLVTGLSNGDVVLWNLVTLRPRIILHAFHGFDVTALAFDPDSNILFCSSVTGLVRIYNYDVTPIPIAEFKESASILKLFYSQSSDLIIIVLVNGAVSLWSNRLYQQISRISTHMTPTTAEWDERNSLLLVCSREIKVFRLVGAEVNQEAKRVEKTREDKLRRHRQREEEKQTQSLYSTLEDPKDSLRREITAEDPLDHVAVVCNTGPHVSEIQLGHRSTSVVNMSMGSLGLPKSTTGYHLVPVTAMDDNHNLTTNPAYALPKPNAGTTAEANGSVSLNTSLNPHDQSDIISTDKSTSADPTTCSSKPTGQIYDENNVPPHCIATIVPDIPDQALSSVTPLRLTDVPLQTTLVRREYPVSDLAYKREGGDRPDNHVDIAMIRQVGLDGRIEPSKYNVHDPSNARKPIDLDRDLLRAHWASIIAIIDVSYYTTLNFNEVELLTLDLFKGLDDNLITFQSAFTFGPKGTFTGISDMTIAPKPGVTTFAFNMGEDRTQSSQHKLSRLAFSAKTMPAQQASQNDNSGSAASIANSLDPAIPDPDTGTDFAKANDQLSKQLPFGLSGDRESFTTVPRRTYAVSNAARNRGYSFALARVFNSVVQDIMMGVTRNVSASSTKSRPPISAYTFSTDAAIPHLAQKNLDKDYAPGDMRTSYSTYEPKTDNRYKLLPEEFLVHMKLFARPYRSMAYRPTPSSTSYMTKTNSQLRKELYNELHRRKSLVRIKFVRVINDTYFNNLDFKTYEARVNLESQALRDETDGPKRSKDVSVELEAEKLFRSLVYKVDHSKRLQDKTSLLNSSRFHPHFSGRMVSKGLYGNNKFSMLRRASTDGVTDIAAANTKTIITYRIGEGSEGGSPINSLINEMTLPIQPPSAQGIFRRRIPITASDTKNLITFSASDLGSIVERTHLEREQSIETLIARNKALAIDEEENAAMSTSETDKTESILADVPISVKDSSQSTQSKKKPRSTAANTSVSITSGNELTADERDSTVHTMHTTMLTGEEHDLTAMIPEDDEDDHPSSHISSDNEEDDMYQEDFEFKLFQGLHDEVEKNTLQIEKELNEKIAEKRVSASKQTSKRKIQLETEAAPATISFKGTKPVYTRLAARQAMNMRRKIAGKTSTITGIDIVSQITPGVVKKLDFLRDIIDTEMMPVPTSASENDPSRQVAVRRKENILYETSISVTANTKEEAENFILKTEQERTARYKTKLYTIDSNGNISLWLLEQQFERVYDSSRYDVQNLKDDSDDEGLDEGFPGPTDSSSVRQRPSSASASTLHGHTSSRLKRITALTIDTTPTQESKNEQARASSAAGASARYASHSLSNQFGSSKSSAKETDISIFKRKDKIVEKPVFITTYKVELPDNVTITSASFDHAQSIILCGLSNGNALVYSIDLTEVISSYNVSNCAKAAINFYHSCSNDTSNDQVWRKELLDFGSVLTSGYFQTKFTEGFLRDYIFTSGRLALCYCEDNTEKLSRKFVNEKLNEYMISQDMEGLNCPPRAILTGHTGGVICLANSRNYSYLITADDEGLLIYWQSLGVAKAKLYFPDQRILSVAFAAEELVPGMAFLALSDGSIWIITPNCRYRMFTIGLPVENIGNNIIKITTTVVQVREVEDSIPVRQMLLAICVNNVILVYRIYANLKLVEVLRPDGTPSAIPSESATALADDINRRGSVGNLSARKSNPPIDVELNSPGSRVTPHIAAEMAVISSIMIKPLICYGPQCACCNGSSIQFMTNNLGILLGGTAGHAFYLPISHDMTIFSKFYSYRHETRTYSFVGFSNIDRSILLSYNKYRKVLSPIPTREVEVKKKNEFTLKLFERLDSADASVKKLFNCQIDDNTKDIVRPIGTGHVQMSNQIIRQNILKAYMLELMA